MKTYLLCALAVLLFFVLWFFAGWASRCLHGRKFKKTLDAMRKNRDEGAFKL